ncbi:MAG: hypothetical protein Q9M23_08545, partial [Mariprofundaceae bacterium]|nr:hypothetical protein [Mariprofundaceae bacterium]
MENIFQAVLLLLLLSLANTALARPYNGWAQFDFPGTTSLHDCMWLESTAPADRTNCGDILSGNLAMSHKPGLDEATREQLDYFGEHPLFFVHADLLHCDAAECTRAHDIRVGPPEHTWVAPVLQNPGSHLLYHMPSELHGKQHMLQISGLKNDWKSEPFSTPFIYNYLIVRFDAKHPGKLDVEIN